LKDDTHPPLQGALNGAIKGVPDTAWIDDLFSDRTGYLKKYSGVVDKLLIRDKEVAVWVEKGIEVAAAENIAVPSKPAIAKMYECSLATVQNVHRVMRETRRIMRAA